MIRIQGLIEILGMACRTLRRGTGVTISMTAGAIDIDVRSGQREVGGIVVKVVGRYPGRFGVTPGTIGRELEFSMVWISSICVVLRVATEAGIRRIVVVSIMASGAVIGDGRVCPVQRIVIIVIGKSSGHPIRFGSVATRTIRSKT